MSRTKKPVIAIDGTAGSGKGTLAKKLASYLGFDHLDSGILYRMFAYEFINQKGDLEQLEKIKINYSILSNKKKLSAINLRSEEVSKISSVIAKEEFVRDKLIEIQRNFSKMPPKGLGSVIDGRDITSVVSPDAEIKFYIDADIKVRAKRRQVQLKLNDNSFNEILKMLEVRDSQDKNRKLSPLIKTQDSHYINTTDLNEKEVFEIAIKYIKNAEINLWLHILSKFCKPYRIKRWGNYIGRKF